MAKAWDSHFYSHLFLDKLDTDVEEMSLGEFDLNYVVEGSYVTKQLHHHAYPMIVLHFSSCVCIIEMDQNRSSG